MSTDLRGLSHEALVAAVSGRIGATQPLSASEVASHYVRNDAVPALRVTPYHRRRRIRDVVAAAEAAREAVSALGAVDRDRAEARDEPSYASFFGTGSSQSAGRDMAVAS